MEAKKRFKLYKSGKLWCCAAVAFGVMALGTVNGQADDATSAATTSQVSAVSQVATPAASTDSAATSSANNAASESTATDNTQTSNNATATSATTTTVATTTLNVQQQSTPAVNANAVTVAAYAASSNLSTADTLDISAYQPNISEETFRQYHNQGINNVIVKLSESTGWTNGYAQQQVSRAQAAGMTVAAYHFVRFTTAGQAQAEAQLFARMARAVGLGNDTMMIADVESVPQTRYAGIVNNLNVFFKTLSSLGYTNHGVYTGLSYDWQYNVSSTVGKARTWVAAYGNFRNAVQGYGAWQYTDNWNGTNIDASIDFGMFTNYAGHQTTSAANLDNFSINANNNTLDVAGWFADNNNQGKSNRYVILLDQDNGNLEITRQQVQPVSRPDVTAAYPDIYGTGDSGFRATFAIDGKLAKAIAAGHHINVLIRYTSSSDGNSEYNDKVLNGATLNKNVGWLDTMTTDKSGIHVVGWHAADQSISRNYHYIILLDATTGTEIGRNRITNINRDDVEQANADVYNSGNSGFSTDFVMNEALRTALQRGDSLQVISRYTNDTSGNNNVIDYWFTPQSYNRNQGWLDDFSVYNGQLRVTGWHAADQSVVEPYQWIILRDEQTGQEVARVQAVTTKRDDVQAAYPNILNANNSGFVANFDIANTPGLRAAILAGHFLKVIARYSDDGQKGEGSRNDYWFSENENLYNNQSAQELESFGINGNQIEATGWYADNRSVAAKAMYVILLDTTTNRELGRQEVNSADRQRPDIASSNSSIANAGMSGFKASFAIANKDITKALKNGDQLQIVARYTDDDQGGEGNYAQHFFNPQSFQTNYGNLDSLLVNSDGSIHARGWHASNQSIERPYHYVLLFDATARTEITRVLVKESNQRPDVQQAYPDVYNSLNSGFNVNFANSAAIRQAIDNGHNLQIIDRYSASKGGNSDFVDYWFTPQRLYL